MAMLGMNVEEVKKIAKDVSREADELQTKINNIGNKIKSAKWEGPDQKKFVAAWDSHSGKVRDCVHMLKETAHNMEKNAKEQEAASNS